jgi:Nif-specific ferredoxin III
MSSHPDQYKHIKKRHATGTTKAGNVWIPQFIETLNQKNCIGCGRCYKVCTRQVFEFVEQPDFDKINVDKVVKIAHPGECIGDAACRSVCPRKNITCSPVRAEKMETISA